MATKKLTDPRLFTFDTEGLTPSQQVSYETLVMERKDWQRAKQCGYLTEAGLPRYDRLRVNQAGTLLGGFQSGFKISDLEDTCNFFLSGESNRYFGDLGLPEFSVAETLAFLMEGVEHRTALASRHRLRDREKEPWAWISLGAAKILGRSPEVRPSTWATYAAICVMAGEAGAEEFESSRKEIAEVSNVSVRSVHEAISILASLRLLATITKPFSKTRYRILSVGKV